LAALGARLLVATWRVHPAGSLAGSAEPRIFAFWHSDLIACGAALRRELVRAGYPVSALVSRSGDGELLARATASFGFGAVRGSSSRGALAGIRGLYRALQAGENVVVTPDGPRGPARVAKPGVGQLARIAGVPIVPMAAKVGGAWRARSWDRTVVPAPFSRVEVTCGPELWIDAETGLEEAAERLSRALEELRRQ
jgi:lysophospholipid acyltransferase (LPLAT)-like uncharacterized protein